MKQIKPTTYFIVLLLAIIFVLTLVLRNKSQKLSIATNNIEAITDTLRTTINSKGEQIASIKALQETNLKNLLKLNSKDSAINQLQEAIKANKGSQSVVVIGGSTDINSSNPTIITKTDTVNHYIYPTYSSKINLNNWVMGSTEANKDSTKINLSISNSYDVVINKKGEAFVTNHNPYSTTKTLRAAITTLPKAKKWIIGPSIGVQWSFTTNKFEPYVGVGLTYKLIGF